MSGQDYISKNKMNKKDLRKYYKQLRRSFTSQEIDDLSKQMLDFFHDSNFSKLNNFHVFISIEKLFEVNTNYFIEYFWENNKQVIVPKMQGEDLMHCSCNSNTILEKNSWGINEPKECLNFPIKDIELVLVPMLICDFKGNRVGYGGGFYDKFLAECRDDIIKLGINFFEPISEEIPTYKTDIPLDYLLTPNGIIDF